jgi:1-aminocyclopropane-1-carboxylate deaminase/D-cysteine desulfhydrase-like pyridoxal-dependent ACC family enzyme
MRFLEPFERFRVPLAQCPSPLEHHEGLGRELGIRLLLKREDRLDDLASGHKVRKLEYVIGHALRHGADTLVTAGSAQSNQCKAVAYAARRLGLHCHLVFCGPGRPADARGNYLVDLLLQARQSWVDVEEWPCIAEHLQTAAKTEARDGRHPWIIAPGASDWLGALGHVRFAAELAAQEAAQGEHIDYVVLPTGSGGTQAGIVVGGALLGKAWLVVGVAVLGERRYFLARHAGILTELAANAGLMPDPSMAAIEVEDRATGGGYANFSSADVDELLELAGRHALVFDPVYMMKALRGLRRRVAEGGIRRGTTVVLVHSGGQHGLFGLDDSFQDHLRRRRPDWFTQPVPPPPTSGG